MHRSTRYCGSWEYAPAAAQHVPGRVFVAVQLEAPHAAPVGLLRQRFGNLRSATRAVLRRAGRGHIDEWNAGTLSLAVQNVEEFSPTLLRHAAGCSFRVAATQAG